MIGFGLWWVLLLLGSLLPDEDLSETGRMRIIIVTMTYGVLIIASQYWTGYKRQERQWLDAHPEERERKIRSLPYSWAFYFVFMLAFHLLNGEDSWQSSVLQALFFATTMTIFNYFYEIGRRKRGAA